jgi:hypothetical protein
MAKKDNKSWAREIIIGVVVAVIAAVIVARLGLDKTPAEPPVDLDKKNQDVSNANPSDTTARKLLAGPRSGKLIINPPPDTIVPWDRAGVEVRDCVVEATFFVPAMPAKNVIWVEGLYFRLGEAQNMGIFVLSNDTWDVGGYGFEADGNWRSMQNGNLPAGVLATKKGDRNRVKVILDGNKGKLFLNGRFVADFACAEILAAGDVAVGFAGRPYSSIQEQLEAYYEDFKVYALR